MPKFVIEREMPGAGSLSKEQLHEAAQNSCDVLNEMGTGIQWMHSYVTDNKIYCIYNAVDEAAVKKHAEGTGLPANKISRVRAIIDPTTAEV